MAGEKGGFEACMDRHPVTKPNITGQRESRHYHQHRHNNNTRFLSLFNKCMRAACAAILMGAVGIGDGVSSGEGTVDSALACLLT